MSRGLEKGDTSRSENQRRRRMVGRGWLSSNSFPEFLDLKHDVFALCVFSIAILVANSANPLRKT